MSSGTCVNHSKVISRLYERFVRDLDPRSLLDQFIAREFLDDIEIRDIKEQQLTSDKTRRILDTVKGFGQGEYELFKECLQESGQVHLVEELQKVEREIQNQETSDNMIDETPSDTSLANISKYITSKQEDGVSKLGERLDIKDGIICQIIADYRRDTTEQLYHILIKQKATLRRLVLVLCDLEEEQVITVDWNSINSYYGVRDLKAKAEVRTGIQEICGYGASKAEDGLQQAFTPCKENILKSLEKGRLYRLEDKQVKVLQTSSNTKTSSNGKVYIWKDEVPGFGMKLVMKEVKVPKGCNAVYNYNDKIASRISHYGIVPLLAFHESVLENEQVYQYVSPYMKNEDLLKLIKNDQDGRQLSCEVRVRIIYQIASALHFLHDDKITYRGVILHMDVKSANIVLDEHYNARLIDFGLARELTEKTSSHTTSVPLGTDGYFQFNRHCDLTKYHDYYNLGVVMRELLTGRIPSERDENGKQLKELDDRRLKKKVLGDAWKTRGLSDDVSTISTKCINSAIDDAPKLDFKTEVIEVLATKIEQKFSGRKWIQGSSSTRCDMCLANTIVLGSKTIPYKLDGHESCKGNIKVCVACMRASHLSPIMCHSCGQKVKPLIGHNWGAILIAGNSKNKELANVFKNDVLELEKVFTSKSLPVMCMSEELVKTICPAEPGTSEHLYLKIENKMNTLSANHNLEHLIFFFSGHGDTNSDIVLCDIDNKERLSMKKLSVLLEKFPDSCNISILLDCCYAETIPTDSLCKNSRFFQFNASTKDSTIIACKKKFSYFTRFLIQALTGRASGKDCIIELHNTSSLCKMEVGPILTHKHIIDYVTDHLRDCPETKDQIPVSSGKNMDFMNNYFAYNYSFPMRVKIELYWSKTEDKLGIYPFSLDQFNTIKELQKELLSRMIEKQGHLRNSRMISDFPMVISIEIKSGPKLKHVREITSMEAIMSAWIGKQHLYVCMRQAPFIDIKRDVAVFLPRDHSIAGLFEELLEKEFTQQVGCNLKIAKKDFKTLKDYLDEKEKKAKKPGETNNKGSLETFNNALWDIIEELLKMKKDNVTLIMAYYSGEGTEKNEDVYCFSCKIDTKS